MPSLATAKAYTESILHSLTERDVFRFLGLEPTQYWSSLLFLDAKNYSGVRHLSPSQLGEQLFRQAIDDAAEARDAAAGAGLPDGAEEAQEAEEEAEEAEEAAEEAAEGAAEGAAEARLAGELDGYDEMAGGGEEAEAEAVAEAAGASVAPEEGEDAEGVGDGAAAEEGGGVREGAVDPSGEGGAAAGEEEEDDDDEAELQARAIEEALRAADGRQGEEAEAGGEEGGEGAEGAGGEAGGEAGAEGGGEEEEEEGHVEVERGAGGQWVRKDAAMEPADEGEEAPAPRSGRRSSRPEERCPDVSLLSHASGGSSVRRRARRGRDRGQPP